MRTIRTLSDSTPAAEVEAIRVVDFADFSLHDGVVTGKQMIKLLQSHGWVIDRVNGSHHILKKEGVSQDIVVPVHGNRDLKRGLEIGNLKKAGLRK